MPATLLVWILGILLVVFISFTAITILEERDLWWIPLLCMIVFTSLIFWGIIASKNLQYTIKVLPVINQNDRQFIIIDDQVINLTKTYNRIFDKDEITIKIPNEFSCGIQFDFTPIEVVDNLEDEE